MKIVIQCAGSKREGGYWTTNSGRTVKFVATPELAPRDQFFYARPDDVDDSGNTWREMLLEYNRTASENPFNLYEAHELYSNAAYGALVDRFGIENVFILSAGWGLVEAGFFIPQYDITFQPKADEFCRRKKTDMYPDFCHLPRENTEPVFFLGGKDYVPLFVRLTKTHVARKTIIYNQRIAPTYPGFDLLRYSTNTRTNWHYSCANDLALGKFSLI